MRYLVTGGAGYVGAHACKALAGAGHEVVVFDNLSTGHREAVKWGDLVVGDLLDRECINRAIEDTRPDGVLHFAALAYVGESVHRPDLYYRTNIAGTQNLLDAMRLAGVTRIVVSSTCATYGTPAEMPISETTPQVPVNPYGRTKLVMETMLRDYCSAFGFGAIALRYFNAAGADPAGEIGEDHTPETHLIPLVLQAAAGLLPNVKIFGNDYPTADGTAVRDYVHVTDLADAHVKALDICASGHFKAFNLGAGIGTSVMDICMAAQRVTGQKICIEMAPRRAGDPPILYADPTLAATELGWTPRQSDLDTILATAWAWMQSAHPGAGKDGRTDHADSQAEHMN